MLFRSMNCVYSRQDNRVLGSDEDSRSAKLFVYIRKDKGLFSIHTYLVTKDDNDVCESLLNIIYTLSQISLISALKIRLNFRIPVHLLASH